jgi:hypothetical protein
MPSSCASAETGACGRTKAVEHRGTPTISTKLFTSAEETVGIASPDATIANPEKCGYIGPRSESATGSGKCGHTRNGTFTSRSDSVLLSAVELSFGTASKEVVWLGASWRLERAVY